MEDNLEKQEDVAEDKAQQTQAPIITADAIVQDLMGYFKQLKGVEEYSMENLVQDLAGILSLDHGMRTDQRSVAKFLGEKNPGIYKELVKELDNIDIDDLMSFKERFAQFEGVEDLEGLVNSKNSEKEDEDLFRRIYSLGGKKLVEYESDPVFLGLLQEALQSAENWQDDDNSLNQILQATIESYEGKLKEQKYGDILSGAVDVNSLNDDNDKLAALHQKIKQGGATTQDKAQYGLLKARNNK